MDPERIKLVLRPRSDWESVDLGLRLAQHHAGLLCRAWLLASLPWALLIAGASLWSGRPWLAFLLFWWSKPLYERVLLHLLSRLAFDDRPQPGQLLRIALTVPFTAAWIRALTFGRFELARSFNLPVWQLEGLRGSARRRRAAVLHLGAGGTGLALSLCTFSSAWLLFLTLIGLVMSVLVSDVIVFDPISLATFLGELSAAVTEGGRLTQAVSFALFYLCEGFVTPFYVAAGFCLYLNRRTHLEAWDIELQFRRAVRRRASIGAGVAASIVFAIAWSGVFSAPLAGADDAVTVPAAAAPAPAVGRVVYDTAPPTIADGLASDTRRAAVRERIREIVAGEEFSRLETQRIWQLKEDEDSADDPAREMPAWLRWIGTLFGSMTELALWFGVLALVVVAYLYRARWLPLLRGQPSRAPATAEPPEGGLLMRSTEMPDDVPAAALSLWQRGLGADAASLLYRALLTTLDRRHRLGVHQSDTEGDCLRRVRDGADGPVSNYFAQVTRSWQSIAYAHRPPSADDFARLCARWYDLVGDAR